MTDLSPYEHGYSALSAKDRRRLAEHVFAAKNYVLAAALFESVSEGLSALESGKLRYARTHVRQGDARFANTASVLPILFRGYCGQSIADALGVELSDAAAAKVERLVQVVCQPSFHPEAILSLALEEGRTELSIVAASVSLWSSATLAWDPDHARQLPIDRLPSTPTVHREQAIIAAHEAGQLWRRIAAISVGSVGRDIAVLDGMTVEGCFRDGRIHDCKAHVACGGPGVELTRILLETAAKHARLPSIAAALEHLFSYLPGSEFSVEARTLARDARR